MPFPLFAIPLIAGAVQGIAGLVAGGSQRGKGRRLMNEAANLHRALPMEDSRQLAYLDDIRTRQRAMEAGTSKMMALRTRQAMSAQAQTQANAARGAGGSAGTLMDVLLGSQRVAGEAINEGAAQEQQQALGLLQMQGPLITDMAQRRYAHQKYLRDLKMAQGAQFLQDASANTAAAIGALGSGGMNALYAGLGGTKSGTGNNSGVGNSRFLDALGTFKTPAPLLPDDYQLGDLRPRSRPNYGFSY